MMTEQQSHVVEAAVRIHKQDVLDVVSEVDAWFEQHEPQSFTTF